MLLGVPKVISPELLNVLCEMGHADTIVLGDGNFPGAKYAKKGGCKFIRTDGIGTLELLDAILKLIPLDYCEKPVLLMEPDRDVQVPIREDYKAVISKYDKRGEAAIGSLERFAFYEAAKESFCIVQTGEDAIYANILLQKGVIE